MLPDSYWACSFWVLHFLLLLCWPWSVLLLSLLQLLLVLYTHWNMSVHLPSLLLCLTVLGLLLSSLPFETALFYNLDLLRLPILSLN